MSDIASSMFPVALAIIFNALIIYLGLYCLSKDLRDDLKQLRRK